MKEYYFDNSATTKVHKEIIEKVSFIMGEEYGNPSSKHHKGFISEQYVKEALSSISKIINCNEDEIIFTSGGTESNNFSLIGTALSNEKRGKHIISTNIEHASIYKPLEFLMKRGFEVTFLNVDKDGRVNVDDLKNAIRDDTFLVSIMHVNNEIGSINDIFSLSKIVKQINPNIIFHTDAIQSFGKFKYDLKNECIDLLSVSGHKIHSMKGVGFLYIKKGTKISPIIFGGGQQKDFRSGTHNVPGIVSLGMATKIYYENFDNNLKKLLSIKNELIKKLLLLNEQIGGITINSKFDLESAPQIVSASFENIRAEVLLHSLEEKNIYVSSGSACSSNHPAISGTLKALGVKNNLLDSTIRFSFSTYNDIEEIDYLINILKDMISSLRRFTRK